MRIRPHFLFFVGVNTLTRRGIFSCQVCKARLRIDLFRTDPSFRRCVGSAIQRRCCGPRKERHRNCPGSQRRRPAVPFDRRFAFIVLSIDLLVLLDGVRLFGHLLLRTNLFFWVFRFGHGKPHARDRLMRKAGALFQAGQPQRAALPNHARGDSLPGRTAPPNEKRTGDRSPSVQWTKLVPELRRGEEKAAR